MIKITELDVDKAVEFMKSKKPSEVKDDFTNKNRGQIYSLLQQSLALNNMLGANDELASMSLMEIVYQLWKTYYSDKETVEQIFGEKQDYLGINDDIIELVNVNTLDKICGNGELEMNYDTLMKAVEDATERITEIFDENEDFFVIIFAKGAIAFLGEPLLMGLLAFYSIEEAIKREKNV